MTKSNWLICIAMLCSSICFAQTPVQGLGNSDYEFPEARNFFSEFSVSLTKSNTVKILWKTVFNSEGEYYVIERSNDQIRYETVSVLKITDTISNYEMMSNAPNGGTYFYRIKWVDKSGNFIYSGTVPIRVSGDFEFKFYPNPTDKLLIVRSAHAIDVEVLDGLGTVRFNKQLASGLQVINLSSLEKGNYVLRVADKESSRVISAQLLKN
ncbi:MAG: T9SS type A sorting domain-containing protein [Chitinophagales bacterium]